MKNIALSSLALGLTLAFTSTDANASPGFVTAIPAAPGSCNTCHTMGGGSPRNDFGLQVEANLDMGAVDWMAICDLDADGDGATNGAELGDPCCTWESGDAAQVAAGDPSNSENTGADECDDGMTPDAGMGDDGDEDDMDPVADNDEATDGGCDCNSTSRPLFMGALAGLFFFSRRRRK